MIINSVQIQKINWQAGFTFYNCMKISYYTFEIYNTINEKIYIERLYDVTNFQKQLSHARTGKVYKIIFDHQNN